MTPDPAHPLLAAPTSANVPVFHIPKRYEIFLTLLHPHLFLTAASHLRRRTGAHTVVHTFHSLVSMHVVYGDDAFDAYDVFLAAGPHHEREFERLGPARGWQGKRMRPAGYPLADAIASAHRAFVASSGAAAAPDDRKVVVFAPTWLKYSALRVGGVDAIRTLLQLGYRVIVRPHPLSFTRDADVLAEIEEICARDDNCTIEGNAGFQSYFLAGFMVSDWSGAAYEFAFALEKPVLFLDVPQKVQSKGWEALGVPAMEDEARRMVGVIAGSDDLAEKVAELEAVDDWATRIRTARERYVYSFGSAGEATVRVLEDEVDRIPVRRGQAS